MRDSWVGLQGGVDAHKWARLLRRAHESAVNGGHVPSIVREVIAGSWERCSETRAPARRQTLLGARRESADRPPLA